MALKNLPQAAYFRYCWERSAWPKRALLASVLWHVALCIMPFPLRKESASRAQLRLPRIEVTWYQPVRDLPPIQPLDWRGSSTKPSPAGEPEKALPRHGAYTFHSRQTIISAPARPSHPRQTLIQPEAPPEPPKILPQLPNIVQWTEIPQSTKPQPRTNLVAPARLGPKKPTQRPPSELPVPELPNLERQAGELNIASSTLTVPKPRLLVPPISVPQVGPRQRGQDAVSAPDIRPDINSGEESVWRVIALSATPVDPGASLTPPEGNLRSPLSISPEGQQLGVPGGSPNTSLDATGSAGNGPGGPGGGSKGSGPPGVTISGNNSNTATSVRGLTGPGGASPALPRSLPLKPESRLAPADPTHTPIAPGFDRIKPGVAPEDILGPKPVYTLHVNMPNLASATGSWVLSFVELRPRDKDQSKPTLASADLTGPVPLRKVDPKYPSSLISAKVEGEVVLYAIIRKDGSVDSIQLVKGIEPELDTNAMQALARWKFRPAQRQGASVELEAIVHIPFRAVPPLY